MKWERELIPKKVQPWASLSWIIFAEYAQHM
jgi:hypothetical protein